LLNSDLKDPTQLKSFLQNKLYRGNETLEKFFNDCPTPKDQEDFFAKKLLEIDTETKLGKTYSRRIAKEEDVKAGRASKVGKWVYYTQKEEEVATAKAEQQGGEDTNKPTADEKKQTAFNNLIIERIKTGKAIPGKGGMYLKVINGKGVLYKFNADGVRLPVDTTGDDLQDMINTIGGTVEVDNKGRRKIK